MSEKKNKKLESQKWTRSDVISLLGLIIQIISLLVSFLR